MNNSEILDHFRALSESKSAKTAKEYSKALVCLGGFVSGDDDSLVKPSAELVEDWGLSMIFSGMTVNTASHYIDVVSALHSEAAKNGTVELSDAFKIVKSKIKNGDFAKVEKAISAEQYVRMRNLACASTRLEKDIAMFVDLFVVSMLIGCKSVVEVAMMKKADIASQPQSVAVILERYRDSRRQYVFPLAQSSKTQAQLEKFLTAKLTVILQSRGIVVDGTLLNTARNFWTVAAMKSGANLGDIYATLQANPSAFPERAIAASPSNSDEIIATVAETFLHNPFKWYAMKLRAGRKFEEIENRISSIDEVLRPAELFYPSLEIKKLVNKKKIVVTQPVIPGIVFFRTRLSDVRKLFMKIGDLAWCFKKSAVSGSYATISRSEMVQFQRAIGQFTSDYEVGPIGSIKPRPGDVVKIVGGMLSGSQGELLKIVEHPKKGVIYQLKVVGDQGFEWRVDMDARLTTKD